MITLFVNYPVFTSLSILLVLALYFHRGFIDRAISKKTKEALITALTYRNPATATGALYNVLRAGVVDRLRMSAPIRIDGRKGVIIEAVTQGILCSIELGITDAFRIVEVLAGYIAKEYKVKTNVIINDKGQVELVIMEKDYSLFYFIFDSKDVLL